MKKLRLVEECKVLTHLIHIEGRAIYFEERPNVIQITGSRGIVYEALQFEANEPFHTGDANVAHKGFAL